LKLFYNLNLDLDFWRFLCVAYRNSWRGFNFYLFLVKFVCVKVVEFVEIDST
jgi:hypothetical protein